VKARGQLTPRDRRALAIGGLILAPLLVFSVLVNPFLHARSALRERVREQRDLLRREMALVASAQTLPTRLADARGALASRQSRFFPGRDRLAATTALVSLVGDEARRQGVLLEGIESRTPNAAGEGIVAVEVELHGRGDLEGLLRWLQALEAGSRLLRVEQLSVARLDGGAPAHSLDVETLTLAAAVRGYLLEGAKDAREGGAP
jgi:type II secretory pathway component PulM